MHDIPFVMLPEAPAEDDARLDKRAGAILQHLGRILWPPASNAASTPSGTPRATERHSGKLLVVGIEGERGMGKTSLLLALGRRALQESERWKVVCDGERTDRAKLFEPSRSQSDYLIADVLEHLDGTPRRRSDAWAPGLDVASTRGRVYVELARKKLPGEFINVAVEEAPSVRELPCSLARVIEAQAQTDTQLAHALAERFDEFIGSRGKALLLLVDDFDLSVATVAEFFDVVHRYLDHPREHSAVLVVAYDRKTLVHAIGAVEPHRRPLEPSQVLVKHIPLVWPVVPLDASSRFSLLWNGTGESGPLRWFWPDDGTTATLLASMYKRALDSNGRSGTEANEAQDEDKATTSEELARQLLAPPLLPATPRLVKRLHNALVEFILQAIEPDGGPPTHRPAATGDASDGLAEMRPGFLVERRALHDYATRYLSSRDAWSRPGAPISSAAVLPFISLLLAADVVEPERGLRSEMALAPDAIFQWLRGIDAQVTAPESRTTERLAHAWAAWRALPEDARWFLAVSVNSDARELGPGLRDGIPATQAVHLDLQDVVDRSSRPVPTQIQAALDALSQRIRSTGLADRESPLRLVARAPLPMMVWLGWFLRHVRAVTALNYYAGRFTPFAGPMEPMRPAAPGATDDLTVMPEARDTPPVEVGDLILLPSATPSHADADLRRILVLLDLVGRPLEARQVRLSPAMTAADPPTHLLHIRRGGGSTDFEPADLEPTLQAVLDALDQLQREGITRFDLALRTPDVLAFFLGHNLHPGPVEIRLCDLDAEGAYHVIGRLADPPVPAVEP